MNLAQLIFPATYVVLAALAALACIAVGFILLHASRKNISVFFPVMFILMALMGITDVALSGRILGQLEGEENMDLSSVATRLPTKLMLALLVGLAVVAVVSSLFQRNRKPAQNGGLFAGLMALYIACAIVPAAFGYKPQFNLGLIYTPIILYALFVSVPANPVQLIQQIKLAMLIIVLGSLAAMLIVPSVALQHGYSGLIPGFNIRLWGLASHANVLGPVALTLLILEVDTPLKGSLLHRSVLFLGAITLILTQSKTSLIAGLVALLIIFFFHSRAYLVSALALQTQASGAARKSAAMVAISGLALLTVSILVLTLFIDYLPITADFLNARALHDMRSAAGRIIIWEIAINEGMKNPLFGYGLSIWSPEFRLSHRLLAAFHAHNQLLQIFSVAGFFGVASFIIYFGLLFRAAYRTSAVSGGATICLLLFLLIRSITEVPLQLGAITSGDFLAHLAFVFFLVACHKRLPIERMRAPKARWTYQPS